MQRQGAVLRGLHAAQSLMGAAVAATPCPPTHPPTHEHNQPASPCPFHSAGIDYLTSTKVTAVDVAAKKLTTAGGEAVTFDKLVVATGARVSAVQRSAGGWWRAGRAALMLSVPTGEGLCT